MQPHLGNRNSTITSLLQLSDRGAIYQSALAVCREVSQSLPNIEVTWSSDVERLDADSRTQKPDVGKLGGREKQEVDFRQAYQRIWFSTLRVTLFNPAVFLGLFSPFDAAESIYPTENADAVYQALDMMPLFWKQASITDEHLLTMYA